MPVEAGRLGRDHEDQLAAGPRLLLGDSRRGRAGSEREDQAAEERQ
jgi:hypothetical protein